MLLGVCQVYSHKRAHRHTLDGLPTTEQDEFVAVATLQRVLQNVLQGPVEEQDLLPALTLPETSAALLGHAVERQQRRRILHHALTGLFTHTHTHTHIDKTDRGRDITWTDNPLKACGALTPEMFDYRVLQIDGAVTVLD